MIDLPAGTPVRLDGRLLVLDRPKLALCRCGASADKPLCDGSHKRLGFTAPAVRIAIETGTGLDETE
ncbi:MAG: CDGSH iron-sulfur domain-containing protein [Acetobacteraceae bacterium]